MCEKNVKLTKKTLKNSSSRHTDSDIRSSSREESDWL